MSSINDKIVIQIPSYCDSELMPTVKSAIIQADNKERVNFAICYQNDDLETLEELKKIPNCKVIHMLKKDAKGLCYARNQCQKLLENEKYIYQIDSHMRFVKHWDTKMIEMLESLHDKKAIISTYPPGYNDDMAKLSLDDEKFSKPCSGSDMCVSAFKSDSYLMTLNSRLIDKNSPLAFKKNAFISGNNFFSYSEACKEVPADPDFIFYGDELPMAIKFYTHGWNVYNPGESYIYHQYVKKARSNPFPKQFKMIEDKHFQDLINLNNENKDLGIYGLGKERTIEDYEKFSGIDFKNKIIYMNAETGDFENEDYINKISYIQQKRIDKELLTKKVKDIEIIIFDKHEEYQKCIQSCLQASSKKNNIKFLIATTKKEEDNNENIKKLIHIKENTLYCKAISTLTKSLSKSYVMIIDSSVIFSRNWDEYYCNELEKCGENALTSWVWKTNDENNVFNYTTIIKEFEKLNNNNNLPVLRYNEEINLKEKNIPYQTPFISDGFLFCKSDIFKKIPIDPKLTYEEHSYIYSVRLWTNGINLYYPIRSYVMKTRPKNELNEGIKNRGVVDALTGISSYNSVRLINNYKYDIGNKRPIWTWYNLLNLKYDSDKMKIIDE